MGKNPKKKKHEKELGLVMSQQTVIRNQAELSLLERVKKGWKSEKEKNEKELGLTDGKFEFSKSKSPYLQILVPNGPL